MRFNGRRTALLGSIATATLILFPTFLANAQNSTESDSDGFGWIVLFVVAALVILALIFEGKCPACGRRWALEKTASKQEREFWKADLEEWRCKYCGHRKREKEQRL